MENIKKHLDLFPERLRAPLVKFEEWEQICEIRLRENLPLSLTSYKENIILNEKGEKTTPDKGIVCTKEDLLHLLGAFCGGCVYRYFENLKEGFAVDQEGWRLGICEKKNSFSDFLSQNPKGINLRIPRNIPSAADDLIPLFHKEGLFSALILSAPGEGKTTLLRALSTILAEGKCTPSPLRVCVIDQREELFPEKMETCGLIDLLSGYEKKEGVELATRLFSPEVIICDEIASKEEANALTSACTGGSFIFASCHAKNLEEAKRQNHLKPIFESGLFQKVITIEKTKSENYERKLLVEDLK